MRGLAWATCSIMLPWTLARLLIPGLAESMPYWLIGALDFLTGLGVILFVASLLVNPEMAGNYVFALVGPIVGVLILAIDKESRGPPHPLLREAEEDEKMRSGGAGDA